MTVAATRYKQRPVTLGQRFVRGVVITPDTGRNKIGQVLVRLLCDCGETYLATRSALWRGDVHSCGCLRRTRLGSTTPKGESHYRAALTADDVREIRRLYASTAHLRQKHPDRWTHRKLARKFGISAPAISQVITCITWAHVKGMTGDDK